MRYFIEVSYKGTNYAGFQIQINGRTIQGELEKALQTIFRTPVKLTGSSRTDAGVHALQNFFHFDFDKEFEETVVYNLNSILPADIVVKSIIQVPGNLHCRFSAFTREYKYYILSVKNPFLNDTAWYYPYYIDIDILQETANMLYTYFDYTAFCKRNTQVTTFECNIFKSEWLIENKTITYNIKANRFLRGMIRGLVGTMLLAARKKITVADFKNIIESKDCTKANFATPAHGLFLTNIEYNFFTNVNT